MKQFGFKIFEQKHVIGIMISLLSQKKGFNTLQKEHQINTSTLQKRLEAMEKESLIIRESCTKDSRSCYYSATEKGHKAGLLLEKIKDNFK